MLNEGNQDPPLTLREVKFIEQIQVLKGALASTLSYIQTRFQPDLPPELKARERLLPEIQPENLVPLDIPIDFYDSVTAMARFLNLASSARAFEKFGVSGFADWTILMALRSRPSGMTDRHVMVTIGMSIKRFGRLSDRLVQAGLMEVSEQNSSRLLSITPSGEQMLETMNASLEASLALFPGRDQLFYTSRKIRALGRMYDGGQPRKKKKR